MDFQEMIDNKIKADRTESLKGSPQMTLGESIAVLESSELIAEDGDHKHVAFDFEYLFPTGIDSWRGSYDELAISFGSGDFYTGEYKDRPQPPTATEFLSWLKEAVGKTYTGYKGGDYVMGKSTPLWVANYGNSGSTGLVGIKIDDFEVKLVTADCEY